jgi:hypothetical protein
MRQDRITAWQSLNLPLNQKANEVAAIAAGAEM